MQERTLVLWIGTIALLMAIGIFMGRSVSPVDLVLSMLIVMLVFDPLLEAGLHHQSTA